MTIYICKCGRRVSKSTNADNTGNRDTDGCKGCPYLLPWGPTQWDATRHAMVTNVKGYECRMSPSLDYATYYQGGGEDKCVLHIYSLDYDFLDQVTTWAAKQFPDKEISCSFDRSKIRATEFIGGLYGMSAYPMQNKKGMAAKAALIERFFGPDGHRLDKTREEEKAIVLAAIEAGKAKAQERKENMDYIISKHEATGRLYAYYKGAFWFWDSHIQRWLLSQFAEDLYQERRKGEKNFTREDLLSETAGFYLLDEYEVDRSRIEALLQCNPKTAEKENHTDVAEDVQQGGEDDLPEVCRSCQCATCGNEDCPTPCFQKDDEVQECKKLGPMGDVCEDYQPKEDAQCQKENAPSAAAAATSDGSAARMCEGPDEETQTTPAAASGAALESLHAQSALPQNAPAQDIAADAPSALGFDFGADESTNAELLQCAQTFVIGKVAQVMAAKRAHDLTANNKNGAFGKWCAAVGISRDKGNQLVNIADNFGNIELEGKPIIEVTPISLLALGAKPSTPDVLTEGIGRGEITTIKQFRDLEAQLKAVQTERDEARKAKEKAEQERDAARDAQANLSAMANKFSKQRDAAEQRVEDAERRAQAAEEDAAGWKQAGLEMQELVDQRDERIRELESGITVEAAAVDQEEIERRANELSEPLVKIIDQQNAQIERMASGNTVAAQASVLEQYINSMRVSLLSNARRTELACYDVGALDSLAQALREFADEIDGLFEEGEENEE